MFHAIQLGKIRAIIMMQTRDGKKSDVDINDHKCLAEREMSVSLDVWQHLTQPW